jgi:putative lipase involved disintegration of autophagic bodies
MHRIDSRTVELTPLEMDIRDDAAEEWDETTDPVDFIHDRSAMYGGVVQEDFVTWLAVSMRGASVDGWREGQPFAGSTIRRVGTDGVVTLANGRQVQA